MPVIVISDEEATLPELVRRASGSVTARGRTGQERLAVGGTEPGGGRSLDEVAGMVGWAEVDHLLAGISASAKGEWG